MKKEKYALENLKCASTGVGRNCKEKGSECKI